APDPPVENPQERDASSQIPLRSLLSGTISAVYVSLNSYVRTGQAMAMVDSDVLLARLDEAKQNLEMQRSAEINAETAAESLQAKWTNAQSYQPYAESELSSAQSAAADARSILDHRDELYRAGALPLDARNTAERSYDEARTAVAAAQARLTEVSQLVDQA